MLHLGKGGGEVYDSGKSATSGVRGIILHTGESATPGDGRSLQVWESATHRDGGSLQIGESPTYRDRGSLQVGESATYRDRWSTIWRVSYI